MVTSQERERQRWTPRANSQRTTAPLSVTDPTAKTDADVDHHYDDPVEADDKPMLLTHWQFWTDNGTTNNKTDADADVSMRMLQKMMM